MIIKNALPALLFTVVIIFQSAATICAQSADRIGNHPAVRDIQGVLQPWTNWKDALHREITWYKKSPAIGGYPAFVSMTFMTDAFTQDPNRSDFIPATQNGMGIISYIKYYHFTGATDKQLLQTAESMGQYLVQECNSPDSGAWPHFTRSTGIACKFPQPANCGTQGDHPYDIQPDKGGIAGYALVQLYKETGKTVYLNQALHNARTLVKNMQSNADSTRSPWPYRADYRTGEPRGSVSANMVYILRLFDELLAMNYTEFTAPRTTLWDWINRYQIPNAKKDGLLWVQFFEDHQGTENRNAWAPLNMARYLLEKKSDLDTNWLQNVETLIDFVNRNFIHIRSGIPICGEQDFDHNPWGGIISTYGAVLAMYTAASKNNQYQLLAWQALNYGLYATDTDGCPGEQASYPCRGGWQEDAHTDKIHNYVDAMLAISAWNK